MGSWFQGTYPYGRDGVASWLYLWMAGACGLFTLWLTRKEIRLRACLEVVPGYSPEGSPPEGPGHAFLWKVL